MMTFLFQRYEDEADLKATMADIDFDATKDFIRLFWGSIPTDMEAMGEAEEDHRRPIGFDWKFAMGDGTWIIVVRTA